MAVPADLVSLDISGGPDRALVYFVPGDDTEDGFYLEWSYDDGSSWEDPLIIPAGMNHWVLTDPPQSINLKARVTPFNGSGPAVTPTVSSTLAIGVAPDVASQTDVYIMIGENINGFGTCLNQTALTSLGATKIWDAARSFADNTLCIGQIKLFVQTESKWIWSLRNDPASLPINNSRAFWWDHVGLQATITAIAPNTPTTGTTEVTFSGSIGRQVGHVFYARFRSTGVANMDNLEFQVTVTATNKVTISSFTASSSSATGTMDLPSFNAYDEDTDGDHEWREVGTVPSTYHGPERSLLALAQDSRGTIGDETNTTSLLVKVHGPYTLASRPVGSATSAKRWTKQREGLAGSKFTDMVRELTDAHEFAVRGMTATAPAPFVIRGIIINAGYNDVSSNVSQTRVTLQIASIAVVGAVATVTCSAPHNLSNVTGKLYTLGLFSGIGGTLGTAINGKYFPLNVTSTTAFEILDIDATGLAATITAGQSIVDAGAPLWFFRDLLSAHIDNVRQAAIDAWDSDQTPDEVPVILWEPSYDPYLDNLEQFTDPATKAVRDVAFSQVRTDMRSLSGAKERVVSVASDDVPHASNYAAVGHTTMGIYYGREGQIRLGEKFWEAIQNPAAGSSSTSRPCVVGIIIGDSYVGGTTASYLGDLFNPEVLSPESPLPSGAGDPIEWLYVYNPATEAIERALVDPSLDPSYLGRTNLMLDPQFNVGQSNRVGIQTAAARELRTAFPDHDIVLFNFGVDGATATPCTQVVTGGARIKAITPGNPTTIELETAGNGGDRIYRYAPFNCIVSGVTGLTPSIDGVRTGTPILVDANPLTRGTQKFTIPVSTTGTAVVSSARVSIPPAIWDPDANDVWSQLETQVPKFFAALYAANYRPDARFALCLLGTNDAVLSYYNSEITTAAYRDSIGRIRDGLRDLFTTRAAPRDELAIVFLEPINHGRLRIPSSTVESFQTALKAAVSSDTRCTTLNVDEVSDRLNDAVTISWDRVHPDTPGFVQLGYRLARRLAAIGTWDAAFDSSLGGSGEGGVTEVVTP